MATVFRRMWSQVLVTHTEYRPGDSQGTNEEKTDDIYRNENLHREYCHGMCRLMSTTPLIYHTIEEWASLHMKSHGQQGAMSKTCKNDSGYSCKHRLLICLRRHFINKLCEHSYIISGQKDDQDQPEGLQLEVTLGSICQLCTEAGRHSNFCPATICHIYAYL